MSTSSKTRPATNIEGYIEELVVIFSSDFLATRIYHHNFIILFFVKFEKGLFKSSSGSK